MKKSIFYILYYFLGNSLHSYSLITGVILIILPVLLDTSILYYTDLLSLTTIIWGFNFKDRFAIAAFCFFAGVLTRQTNIVWALMYCVMSWVQNIDIKRPISSTIKIVLQHWAFVFLGAGFLLFIYVNNGIVLGDKLAHKPVLHFMQILYFFAFVAFSSLPLFILELINTRFWIYILQKPFVTIVTLAIFVIIVEYFSLAHPYLLADNRHFTFYLWRRILDRSWVFKFALIPFYFLAAYYTIYKLHVPFQFFSILFLFCVTACIVPAHLFEFRYFIVPYSLWRLSVFEPKKQWVVLEVLWSIVVNFICLYLFITKPFVWNHDLTNAIQRFMW